ncbi:MAG TPA: GspH/FimT family pseudopilin [Terriglobia bacterium]|nr:GspH/FimT family pseudopilin [Terriglobia bacterium]
MDTAISEMATGRRRLTREAGVTLFELIFVILIGAVLSAIALPATKTALESYRLSAAVSAASGAIQAARYQSIMQGYHFKITFTAGSSSYQISSKVPPATTFSNVGSAVLWNTTTGISMTPTTTLEFFPGGMVQATTGSMTFTITNGTTTKTITVSAVGDVTVT